MDKIKFNEKLFSIFISEEEIINRVNVLAEMINEDFEDQDLEVIIILKGAFMFGADLIRKLNIKHNLHFASISSYVGDQKKEEMKIDFDFSKNFADKHILIIEDVIDSGQTLLHFVNLLHEQEPLEVSISCLLYKQKDNNFPFPVEYAGFEIEDEFVIGYGMDYFEDGRNLRNIYIMEEE